MLGKVFAVLVISSFLFAGFSGNMAEVCTAAIDGANEAVTLSISLLGVMCLWSGVIRTLDKAGLTRIQKPPQVFSSLFTRRYTKTLRQ